MPLNRPPNLVARASNPRWQASAAGAPLNREVGRPLGPSDPLFFAPGADTPRPMPAAGDRDSHYRDAARSRGVRDMELPLPAHRRAAPAAPTAASTTAPTPATDTTPMAATCAPTQARAPRTRPTRASCAPC